MTCSHLRAMLGCSLHQALHDSGIDVEEVVPGHAGLSGDASGDDDQFSSLECCCQLLWACVGGHLCCWCGNAHTWSLCCSMSVRGRKRRGKRRGKAKKATHQVLTRTGVLQCEMSAPTPATPMMSYRASSVTSLFIWCVQRAMSSGLFRLGRATATKTFFPSSVLVLPSNRKTLYLEQQ